jgi:hypothetical protein
MTLNNGAPLTLSSIFRAIEKATITPIATKLVHAAKAMKASDIDTPAVLLLPASIIDQSRPAHHRNNQAYYASHQSRR